MAKQLSLTAGPFIGMNDCPSLGAQDAQRARLLINMYGPASSVNGDVISRPRYNQVSFAPIVCTGTISFSGGPGGLTVTGVGTKFTTQLSVGDFISATGGGKGIVRSIASDTSMSINADAGAPSGATFTVTQGGIVGGQILGCWQHTLTTGTYHRLFLVSTTTTLVGGGAAGQYRFLNASNVRIRLVEWLPGAANAPYQTLVDRTSVSMDGVALGTLNRIYALSFANYFIITDGTNRPRKIDSSWVLSNMTDANYAFYGPFTVYYGSLFGIDASDQITMRWSQPNAPDSGYGTSTSNNSWALQQTSSDPLQCLIGTNQALFAFRQNSVAIITGASNSDFRSSGAVDAVQAIGTRSPDSVHLAGGSVVFMDQYMRPGRIQLGYGYIPLWTRIQETLRLVGKTPTLESSAWGRYDPTTNLIKFGYRGTSSSTTNEQMLVFDATSFECFGTHVVVNSSGYAAIDHGFSGGNPQTSSPMLDANLLPIHVVASGTTGDCAFYWQDHEDVPANVSQDVLANGTLVTVQGTVVPPLLGVDTVAEKHFDSVTVGVRNVGGGAAGYPAVNMQYRTAYADYTSVKAMQFSGTGHTINTWDGASYKLTSGKMAPQASRYLECKFTNIVTGNPATRFTFDMVTVSAHESDAIEGRR